MRGNDPGNGIARLDWGDPDVFGWRETLEQRASVFTRLASDDFSSTARVARADSRLTDSYFSHTTNEANLEQGGAAIFEFGIDSVQKPKAINVQVTAHNPEQLENLRITWVAFREEADGIAHYPHICKVGSDPSEPVWHTFEPEAATVAFSVPQHDDEPVETRCNRAAVIVTDIAPRANDADNRVNVVFEAVSGDV